MIFFRETPVTSATQKQAGRRVDKPTILSGI